MSNRPYTRLQFFEEVERIELQPLPLHRHDLKRKNYITFKLFQSERWTDSFFNTIEKTVLFRFCETVDSSSFYVMANAVSDITKPPFLVHFRQVGIVLLTSETVWITWSNGIPASNPETEMIAKTFELTAALKFLPKQKRIYNCIK